MFLTFMLKVMPRKVWRWKKGMNLIHIIIILFGPNNNFLTAYLQYHPHQPQTNIPFSAAKAYTRKDGGNRIWVTFRSDNPAIFCSLCILYGKYTDNNGYNGLEAFIQPY